MLSNLFATWSGRVTNLVNLSPSTLNDDKHHAFIDLNGLTDNQGALAVAPNTEITVRANENPSTGYKWAMTNSCGAKLALKSDDFSKSANGGLGAGGERVWVFETLGADANYIRGLPCDVSFSYKRPWLKEADSAEWNKHVTVTIN